MFYLDAVRMSDSAIGSYSWGYIRVTVLYIQEVVNSIPHKETLKSTSVILLEKCRFHIGHTSHLCLNFTSNVCVKCASSSLL